MLAVEKLHLLLFHLSELPKIIDPGRPLATTLHRPPPATTMRRRAAGMQEDAYENKDHCRGLGSLRYGHAHPAQVETLGRFQGLV